MAPQPMPAIPSQSATPQVSFVVPLYNCLALTQAMLASLRATMPLGLAWELIFVDDNSSDGTPRWLESLPDTNIRALRKSCNQGFASAVNNGVAIARGAIVVILNNDLVLTGHWLEPMLAVHSRLGHRAGVIGNCQTAARDGSLDHLGIRFNHKGKPEHIRDRADVALLSRLRGFQPVHALTGACFLLSRELWDELGGFDTRFVNGCEDVDLCLRAGSAGRINAVALRSIVRHHISSSPGRKLMDERNTFLLTLKWRDTLAILASRHWCRAYLSREWTHPGEPHHACEAAAALAYSLHLIPNPPSVALRGMLRAIELELDRWRQLDLQE